MVTGMLQPRAAQRAAAPGQPDCPGAGAAASSARHRQRPFDSRSSASRYSACARKLGFARVDHFERRTLAAVPERGRSGRTGSHGSAGRCRSSASPDRASSRDRPRPAAGRRAALRAGCGARGRPRGARTGRRGCSACPGTPPGRASACPSAGRRSRRRRAGRAAPNSWSRKPTSNGALWMIHSASRANSTNAAAMSANFGLPLRSSHVIPWTSAAPGSTSRSGSTWKWIVRPVRRRSTSSTAATSMMRWPCLGSRPVVSVSRMIWRMRAGSVRRGAGGRRADLTPKVGRPARG